MLVFFILSYASCTLPAAIIIKCVYLEFLYSNMLKYNLMSLIVGSWSWKCGFWPCITCFHYYAGIESSANTSKKCHNWDINFELFACSIIFL